jgi:hypothetical protein
LRYCNERGRLDGFGGRCRDVIVFGGPFFVVSEIGWFRFISAATSLAGQTNLNQIGDILVDRTGVSFLLRDAILEQ